MRLLSGVLLGSLFVHAIPFSRRDLTGLLDGTGGDDDQQLNPDLDSSPELVLSPLMDASITTIPSIRTKTTSHTTHGGTSRTIIQFSPSSSTTTTEFTTSLVTTPPWATSTIPVSGSIPVVPEAPITSAEEATQWKVIGIGIITVGFIATVILSIIFFDPWWNFLCDLVCGRGRKGRKHQGQEDMIPNWETRDWEFKLANEDGHRYPTISSLADIAEGQPGNVARDIKLLPSPDTTLVSPKPVFLPEMDSAQQNVSREQLRAHVGE